MEKLIVLSAVVALTACNSREETTVETDPAATATATTVAEVPAPGATQAATGSMVGTYEMKMADGKMATETINPDGSYIMLSDGKETKGRWRMDGVKSCFDPDGDGAEVCYTSTAPAADGSFTVTAPDGTVFATIRKTGAAPGM